jgi:Asp-tRNA(Asn)/Glu-tRNA(Gln) amidotransferase A subunit family amidase
VGAELLGRDYSEPLLLSIAYAYEQAVKPRKAPLSTPPLR